MNPLLKKVLIGLLVLLGVITIVLVVLRFLPQKTAVETPSQTGATSSLKGSGTVQNGVETGGQGTSGQVTQIVTPKVASEQEVLLQKLTNASRDFSERYGSYSTQGDFENLKALLPAATQRMQTEMNATIQKGVKADAAFYGVTTKFLSATPSGSVTKAAPVQVVVQTQRTTTKGTETTVAYQKLSLTLVYQGEVWLVDAAQWQ